jgi:hypothetical protein
MQSFYESASLFGLKRGLTILMVDPYNNHENDIPPSSDGGFISSRPWVMDYVDVNGLSNRIGLPKDRFIEFVVKETVDNALDFMEKEAPRLIKKYGAFTPELKLIVTKESNYLRIRILNSDCETSGFTEPFIRSIFNFYESTGSKRNQYKVTKGWLGDALKAICGIPYALTHEVGNDNWNEPLIITSRNRQFLIKPVIDRAKKKLYADVEIVELSHQTKSFTEFEIRYSAVVDGEKEIITKLSNLFLRFALINLHIAFSIELPGMDILDIPAVQTISEKWSNQISIWCCSPNRDYNRAIRKMTDYTSEKFEILPDSMKRVIRHIFNLADAAAESEEKRIESEQESTKGFIDIVNKKKENVKRLADVVARDYDIQIVESKLEDS